MGKIHEHEVVAFHLGEKVNRVNLSALFPLKRQGTGNYADCLEFVIRVSNVPHGTKKGAGKGRKCKTDELLLFLYVKNNVIIGAHISKHRSVICSDGENAGYETEPTIGDVDRVAAVLRFITASESDNPLEGKNVL